MNQKKIISIVLMLVVLAGLCVAVISNSDEELTSTSQATTETTTEVSTEPTIEPTTESTTKKETTTEVSTTKATTSATTTTAKPTTTTQKATTTRVASTTAAATTKATTTKATTTKATTTTQKATTEATTASSTPDWVLDERATGCSICGSKSCPSLYATNEWGYATVDATLCSKYASTLYCQTCGKKTGDGTNNTCCQWIVDATCDLRGASVSAWACHTCS